MKSCIFDPLGIIAYGKWPNANKDGDLVKKIHDPIKDKS